MSKFNGDSTVEELYQEQEKILKEMIRINNANEDDSFTMILDGEWGIGKSTLMHHFIRETEIRHIIFDALKYRHISDPISAFLCCLYEQDTSVTGNYKNLIGTVLNIGVKSVTKVDIKEIHDQINNEWKGIGQNSFLVEGTNLEILRLEQLKKILKKLKLDYIIFDNFDRLSRSAEYEFLNLIPIVVNTGVNTLMVTNLNAMKEDNKLYYKKFGDYILNLISHEIIIENSKFRITIHNMSMRDSMPIQELLIHDDGLIKNLPQIVDLVQKYNLTNNFEWIPPEEYSSGYYKDEAKIRLEIISNENYDDAIFLLLNLTNEVKFKETEFDGISHLEYNTRSRGYDKVQEREILQSGIKEILGEKFVFDEEKYSEQMMVLNDYTEYSEEYSENRIIDIFPNRGKIVLALIEEIYSEK